VTQRDRAKSDIGDVERAKESLWESSARKVAPVAASILGKAFRNRAKDREIL